METGTKGGQKSGACGYRREPIGGTYGAYLCQKCKSYQSLYEWEIEREIADEYAFLDRFKCNFCGWMNEYRFPRW